MIALEQFAERFALELLICLPAMALLLIAMTAVLDVCQRNRIYFPTMGGGLMRPHDAMQQRAPCAFFWASVIAWPLCLLWAFLR